MVTSRTVVDWNTFMVALKQAVHGRLQICGGTVVTETLTLTAAHCLLHGVIGMHLQFGTVFLFGGRSFQATSIYLHEAFDKRSLKNDIGMVSIFPARVTFGSYVQPVMLPHEGISLNPPTLLSIYGWGAVSERKSFSEDLRRADLPLVSQSICKTLLKEMLPENTFCLGYYDGHVDACLGDSGGPAMLEGTQVGITSFGDGCGLPLKPGVYTDLRKYVDWVQNAIETLN